MSSDTVMLLLFLGTAMGGFVVGALTLALVLRSKMI